MRKQMQDERIIQKTRKQNSLAFTILYLGVLMDLLYRQFILVEPISRYWDLAFLFFGVTFYLAAIRTGSGLLSKINNPRPIVLSSIIATIVFSMVNYLWLRNTSPTELIAGGITFFIAFAAISLLMQYVSNRKNNEILEDD